VHYNEFLGCLHFPALGFGLVCAVLRAGASLFRNIVALHYLFSPGYFIKSASQLGQVNK
jgi:hypothetical protein